MPPRYAKTLCIAWIALVQLVLQPLGAAAWCAVEARGGSCCCAREEAREAALPPCCAAQAARPRRLRPRARARARALRLRPRARAAARLARRSAAARRGRRAARDLARARARDVAPAARAALLVTHPPRAPPPAHLQVWRQ
ncbi:MAG: hypothetical protein H6828_08135 [Planctomycetes bacterium]|nr:hypothetical protein [Planctomycetota bacterium]